LGGAGAVLGPAWDAARSAAGKTFTKLAKEAASGENLTKLRDAAALKREIGLSDAEIAKVANVDKDMLFQKGLHPDGGAIFPEGVKMKPGDAAQRLIDTVEGAGENIGATKADIIDTANKLGRGRDFDHDTVIATIDDWAKRIKNDRPMDPQIRDTLDEVVTAVKRRLDTDRAKEPFTWEEMFKLTTGLQRSGKLAKGVIATSKEGTTAELNNELGNALKSLWRERAKQFMPQDAIDKLALSDRIYSSLGDMSEVAAKTIATMKEGPFAKLMSFFQQAASAGGSRTAYAAMAARPILPCGPTRPHAPEAY
jgi:hypothetical protein